MFVSRLFWASGTRIAPINARARRNCHRPCLSHPLRMQLCEGFQSGGNSMPEVVTNLFRKIDKGGKKGRVTKAKFAKLLTSQLKMRLSTDDMHLIEKCLDLDGSHDVTYNDFVTYIAYQPEDSRDDVSFAVARLQEKAHLHSKCKCV